MKLLRTIPAARRFCQSAPAPVVLVPTMGALHPGHAALIERARRVAGPCGTVVVSIFVNPTQFGPKEDLAHYPRTLAADRALCAELAVDAIFVPNARDMYPPNFSTWVDEISVSLPLEGAARPGHFRGVCTVVLKLFTITGAAVAVFGRKDFQQCAVISRMIRDLNLPIRLVFAETVRESGGLALSSRNAYLTPQEREDASIIRRAFLSAWGEFRKGQTQVARLRKLVADIIASTPLARVAYLEFVHGETLQPMKIATNETVLVGAVYFGRTRLIDNIRFSRQPV